jgi:hypothetical protein
MISKGRYLVASSLTLTLAAAGAVHAALRDHADETPASPQIARPAGDETAVWFPVSFEPALQVAAAPLGPGGNSIHAAPASPPQQVDQIQAPETVRNLRRADH